MCFYVKSITIDHINKIISIRNIIFRTGRTYSFTELDGYFDTHKRHTTITRNFETVGIIKDGNVLIKIDSFFYSNVGELKTALNELKYLGYYKFNMWGDRK